MANDVNANIHIGLDTSDALSSLRVLQSQISAFNKSIIQSNAAAVAQQQSMVNTLAAQVGATKQFSTSMTTVESSVSRLGRSIDKNKLSLGEYFRYGVASSKNFGRVFAKEHTQIMDLASERVKTLQTQYVALGQAQNGMTKAMAVRPLNLFNADAAIATQRQQLFNKLLHDGSTSLINFGKNTQWAGRQLMVGFTVPLTIFGGVAGQIFMDLERQVVNFRRVYGDAMTPAGETDQMVEEIQNLGKEFTKYGIAVKDTVALAGDVAAAGAQGDDLVAATAQSTRLATLGMIDMNQAMTATMALQTAFRLSNEELAQSVDFLNAVENQTVLSLEDVTEAIPKVAPVIKGLGGDVQDLAIFLTAMREGGVSAAEGANALKSGLASLINPTKAAREQLNKVGIDIKGILSTNRGDIRAIVTEFGAALGTLDKFQRQQTLAKVFGKYQFARLGALFDNISRSGSQAQRVVDLTGQSFEELNALAEKELGAIEESVGMKFTGAVERLKLAIAPIGEVFLKVATPIIEIVTKLVDKFNELSPGVKQFITILVAGVGVVVPTLIMLIGLFGNFVGQAIKGFSVFNKLFTRLSGGGKDLEYLSNEQLQASAAAASLEGKTNSLTSALNVQRSAVNQLARAYGNYAAAANATRANLPQGVAGPRRMMATGGMVGGTGNKDTEPALLTPGEFVINADASKKFAPLLAAINNGEIGKYAQGRVPFSVGGREFSVNVAGQAQARAIQDRLNRALSLGADKFEQVANIVDSFGDELISVIGQVDKKISSAGISEALPASARNGGVRYSYPGKETIAESLSGAGLSTKEVESELRVANISAQGAVKAVEENVDLLRELGYKEKDLAVEAGIARSHMIEVDKSEGLAAWHADFWQAQSQAENNFLQTVRGSEANQKMLLSYLERELNSTQDAQALMAKIKSGVGLTQDEFESMSVGLKAMLTDVKTNRELASQIAKSTSPKFLKGAIAAEGAASARRGAGVSYSVARSAGKEAISGLRSGVDANSESREAQRVANDVVDGFANQIERRAVDAKVSGEKLGKAAVTGAKSGTSDIRQILKEQLGVGPLVEQEQANLRETIKLRKQENREILRRAQLLARQGYGPDVAKRLAREQLAAEKVVVPTPSAKPNMGLQVAPPAVQNKIKDSMTQLANQTSNSVTSMTKLSVETNKTSRVMSSIKTKAVKFGSALNRGAGKITGAMFALDGLIFAASMMDNSLGQAAQQIMPAFFAVQGIGLAARGLVPAIGALVGAVGAVTAGIVAAVAAVAVLGFAMKKASDTVNDRARELGQAMYGTSQAMNDTAAFFERKTWEQKFSDFKMQRAGAEPVTQEQATQAQQYVQSDAGQRIVEDIRKVLDSLGSEEAAKALQNQLQSAILKGAIPAELGGSIAREIGLAIGSERLGLDVVANMVDVIGPDGSKIRGNRIEILADIIGDADPIADAFQQAGVTWDGSSWYSQISMIFTGSGVQDLFAENLSAQIQGQQELIRNEITRTNLRFLEGKIGIDKYKESLMELNEFAKNFDYESIVEKSIIQSEDFNTDIFGQNLVDSLRRSIQMLEGENFTDDLFKKFAKDVEYNTSAGVFKDSINLFDPENVRETVDQLKELGDFAQAQAVQEDYNAIMNLSLAVQGGEVSNQAVVDLIKQGKNMVEVADLLISPSFEWPDAETEMAYLTAMNLLEGGGSTYDLIVNAKAAGDWETIKNLSDLVLRAAAQGLNIDTEFRIAGGSQKQVDKTLSNLEEWDKLASKKIAPIKRMVSFATENFGLSMDNIKDWDKLSDFEKKERLMAYIDYFVEVRAGVADSLEQVRNQMGAAAFNATYGSGATDYSGAAKNYVAEQAKKQANAFLAGLKQDDGGRDTGGKDTSGGGGGQESWLQGLIKEIDATLQILPKEMNKLKKKFGGDLPQNFIEMIGFGEEGLARITELLGLKGKDLQNLVNRWIKKTTSEINQGLQGEINLAQQEQQAMDILMKEGFSKDDASQIASNSEYAFYVIQAAAGKTKKKLEPLLNDLRKLLELSNSSDPNAAAIDALKERIDLTRKSFEVAIRKQEDLIDSQQDYIDSIQDEIDVLEELNAADQRAIRDKDRSIEMLNRDINAIERSIDANQRLIDEYKRQDEERNRVSESLSHDLEMLSQAEEDIRNAYDEKIKALDEIVKINDHLINQQKQQLDLSRAISEGDIYAATAAAQQMRASSAGFAADQVRASMQQGMENQIAGLRTAGGLTREEAEQQIADIKEQSYQTSLLIQKIEDDNYNKNLAIRDIKDDILKIEDAKLIIQDRIYDRETEIQNIQVQRLDPAKKYYEALVAQRDELKNALDAEILSLEAQIDSLDIGEEKINQINDIAKAWWNVDKAIASANKTLEKGLKEAGEMPVPVAGQSAADYQAKLDVWKTKRKALQDRFDTSVASAFDSGRSAIASMVTNKFAGGKMKKYAAGSMVIGSGSRDSVPAMLAPGEFVIRKAMVDKYGTPMFDSINQGSFSMPKYSLPENKNTNVNSASNVANINAPVYNTYDMKFAINGTNANADDIANRVMMKIAQAQSQGIRSSRGY